MRDQMSEEIDLEERIADMQDKTPFPEKKDKGWEDMEDDVDWDWVDFHHLGYQRADFEDMAKEYDLRHRAC
jgi:hypothetical protein